MLPAAEAENRSSTRETGKLLYVSWTIRPGVAEVVCRKSSSAKHMGLEWNGKMGSIPERNDTPKVKTAINQPWDIWKETGLETRQNASPPGHFSFYGSGSICWDTRKPVTTALSVPEWAWVSHSRMSGSYVALPVSGRSSNSRVRAHTTPGRSPKLHRTHTEVKSCTRHINLLRLAKRVGACQAEDVIAGGLSKLHPRDHHQDPGKMYLVGLCTCW